MTDYSTLESKFKKIEKKNNIVREVKDMPDENRYDCYPAFSSFKFGTIEFGITNQWDKPTIEAFIKVASAEFGYIILKK